MAATELEKDISEEGKFRSGFVAVMGQPNVSKSTLVNTLMGQRSPLSPRPPDHPQAADGHLDSMTPR
jgi:ribosome biogenesis GTPase A